jgi:hypothetical protein
MTKSLLGLAALAVLATFGYVTGIVVDLSGGAAAVGLSVMIGFGCLIASGWKGIPRGASNWNERASCLVLVVYILVTLWLNPLVLVNSTREVGLSILLLTPVALGAAVFGRRGRWIASLGAMLIFFGLVVAVTFNVFHRSCGVGVFECRRE